ncbi:hypothetical protein MSBRW_2722 [Methanosarcina barkeri str. Wiesmoor]|uniref:Uncharacterized protein n=2 Tax=Methanosarcina barkeri TaxID=2208 RepID=A0A0E3QNI3_METBA|nr:hypothetical protein MSBRW_2722 [Methanosarcina barkeri str. Wiesmoor]
MAKEGIENLEHHKTVFNCLLNTRRVNIRQRLSGRQFRTSRKCLYHNQFLLRVRFYSETPFLFRTRFILKRLFIHV